MKKFQIGSRGLALRSEATNGFTFVEIVIYIGLLLIILLILAQIFSSILDTQLQSQATSQVQQDARFLVSRFIFDINRAESIQVPASPGQQSDSLQLVDSEGVTNTYSLVSGNLAISNIDGVNNLNSYGSQVSNLTFTRLGNTGGNHTIKVSFTITSTTLGTPEPEIQNIETAIGLR